MKSFEREDDTILDLKETSLAVLMRARETSYKGIAIIQMKGEDGLDQHCN